MKPEHRFASPIMTIWWRSWFYLVAKFFFLLNLKFCGANSISWPMSVKFTKQWLWFVSILSFQPDGWERGRTNSKLSFVRTIILTMSFLSVPAWMDVVYPLMVKLKWRSVSGHLIWHKIVFFLSRIIKTNGFYFKYLNNLSFCSNIDSKSSN